MSDWREWLKQMVFCICFLELLYQILPGKNWQKYLKFTGGLVFVLVLFQPVLQIFSFEGKLEQAVWKWQIKEESMQLQEARKELEELQNEQIRQSYCRELERQIQERTEYYGGKVQRVQVTLSQGENMQMEKMEVYLLENPKGKNRLRENLAASYDLRLSQVQISVAGNK
ncbi:stage III sporulation protein AF [Jingyaoa shaoxingensis]|uniref:Stage III sporulation protein AF n=1 Tax=Jingyaoa shaoxingensis TaxID=2763671 RepID=A0ABR7NC22_9FIRM|nr:stage III sporulation protein AF [Jingyaoa shaoxingensis]MBC8573387.1 stage III sporulation protein AF [Jingyaoa shaoxingensis]